MIGNFDPTIFPITIVNKRYFIRVIHWFNSVHQNRIEWNENEDYRREISRRLEHSFEVSQFENISSQFKDINETYLWMRKEFRCINRTINPHDFTFELKVSIYYMQIPIEMSPDKLDELKSYLIQTLQERELTEFVIRTPVGLIDQNQQKIDSQKLTIQLPSGFELIL